MGGLWEGNADGVLHVAHDHASGFGMLQKPGDKVPFIEIDLRKSLAGLLPGPGHLALAFPSFLGTPTANSPRPVLQPPVSRSMAARNSSSPCRRANRNAASRTLAISRRNAQADDRLNAGSPASCRSESPSSRRSSSVTASSPNSS